MEIIRHKYNTPNVGKVERGASVMAGTLLTYLGIRQKGWSGAGMALLGTAFLRRGITGFCYSYQALGFRTSATPQNGNATIPYELGIRVDEAMLRPAVAPKFASNCNTIRRAAPSELMSRSCSAGSRPRRSATTSNV